MKYKINEPVRLKDNADSRKWFPNSGEKLWIEKDLKNGKYRLFDGQGSFDLNGEEIECREGININYFKD